jgi:hypothetical protein
MSTLVVRELGTARIAGRIADRRAVAELPLFSQVPKSRVIGNCLLRRFPVDDNPVSRDLAPSDFETLGVKKI